MPDHNQPVPCGAVGPALLLAAFAALNCHGGGITLITHGNSGTTSGWVRGMADALSARLDGAAPLYRLDVSSGGGGLVTSITRISGGDPLTHPSGEIIVMLDWGPVSSGSTTTYQVAAAVTSGLTETNFVQQLEGRALAELPIHVIGHSRGASVISDLSRRMGERGIWVDQVTSLDAYPLTGDAPVLSHENVLFADCYYQTANLFLDGLIVAGSFWRKQTNVSGGYSGFFLDGHSDVHLWYHGTIDLATPTSDYEVSLSSTMRSAWWTANELQGTNAGFYYTRHGQGSRLSSLQPNGSNSSQVRAGFNQYHDLGAGLGANRTALATNAGEWPNPIRLGLTETNLLEHGQTAFLDLYFQWAQPVTVTQTVEVLADLDLNPFNGNETLLLAGTASGTTGLQVGAGTIEVPLEGATLPPGQYRFLVRMTGGGRTRHLHTSEVLQVVASTQSPWLDVARLSESALEVGVNGVAGQTVVLEQFDEFSDWMPVATNVLATARWALPISIQDDAGLVLYRARRLP